jgi:2'-5' RNA ligase
MANYFIEVRIMGQMKHEIRAITYDVRRNCHIRGSKPIPHISIVSNPTPDNPRQYEKKLIYDFISICSNYSVMELQFNGFGSFPNYNANGVAKINVKPSKELLALRWDLISHLKNYCQLDRRFDAKKDYYSPHITIAMNLNQNQLSRVMTYLSHKNQPKNHHYMARATLLKNRRILREYDFFLKRPLTRSQALNPIIRSRTYAMIKKQINKKKRLSILNEIINIVFYPIILLKAVIQKLTKH